MLGFADAEVTVATTVGSTRSEPGRHPKTEVTFFAAGSQDVRDRLRPIIEAGFEVEGVTTPCGALWSQARLRRPPLAGAGAVHAYVALSASQSAVGIFRKGSLALRARYRLGILRAGRRRGCAEPGRSRRPARPRSAPLVPLPEAVLGRRCLAGCAVRRHAGNPVVDGAPDRALEYRSRDARYAGWHRHRIAAGGFRRSGSVLPPGVVRSRPSLPR